MSRQNGLSAILLGCNLQSRQKWIKQDDRVRWLKRKWLSPFGDKYHRLWTQTTPFAAQCKIAEIPPPKYGGIFHGSEPTAKRMLAMKVWAVDAGMNVRPPATEKTGPS
jgi:hypothetical protein